MDPINSISLSLLYQISVFFYAFLLLYLPFFIGVSVNGKDKTIKACIFFVGD